MKSFILMGLCLALSWSCSPRPTSEAAKSMFRGPSSEEKGKIPDKFQPIDHKIDTASDKELPP